MIKWRLAVMMAERGIGTLKLAELTGLNKGTVSKHKNDVPERLQVDVLDKYCEALQCQPGELLVWERDL